MKIVVPVKTVASLDDEFELEAGGRGVDLADIEWELNEWDQYSLEAALRLQEQHPGTEVTVVTIGDEQAEEALLGCLARGADRAVRLWDERLRDADPLAIAFILASVVGRGPADLVLCGVQSADAAHGATGVSLAGLLGLRSVAVVKALELDVDAQVATIGRELEGGVIETLRLDLPALLTIQTGINEPRYATLRAIKRAADKPLEHLDLDAVGLAWEQVEAAAGSRIRALRRPDPGTTAEMIDGDVGEIAARIAELIKERLRP